jgi:serine/threonine-protein kinase
MVCERANRPEVVKVVDFGIARSLSVPHEYETEAGMVMGTPAYMSPEQARGERDLDARTDVFSLAIIVYQMLTGSLPFPVKGLTTFEMVERRAHLERLARPLAETHAHLNIPVAVDRSLARALEPARERRTQSAAEFIEELERAVG